MAFKIDKDLITKANNSKLTRELFRQGIELVLSADVAGMRRLLGGTPTIERVMMNLCMGKDGNTLVHRLFTGITESEAAIEMVEILTKNFSNEMLNLPNAHGMYPIHSAVENNIGILIDYLIEKKVNLEKRTKTQHQTPAILAAQNADIGLLQKLCLAGADVTAVDSAGNSCEHYVIETLGEEAARQWSVLMSLQSATKSNLLLNNEEVLARRTHRAL